MAVGSQNVRNLKLMFMLYLTIKPSLIIFTAKWRLNSRKQSERQVQNYFSLTIILYDIEISS